MISDPNLIFYACIAKGTTILAEFTSKEPGLETLAQQCIEKTPPYHSMFSHTVRQRTYTFLIDDPFVYFAIYHEKLEKSESFWFLNRVKSSFEEIIESRSIMGFDDFTSYCCQGQFNSIFCEIMALDLELMNSASKDSRNPSLDFAKGKKTVVAPLLGEQSKLKKKKRLPGEVNGDGKDVSVENKVDGRDDGIGACKDYSLSMQKSGLYVGDRQKAKQIWRKHVWVVLSLDLFVCFVLFGIWLWVCQGFQCIDG